MRELIIDSFAGGGGASTGIYMALGRHPDIAINHSEAALAMHRANHPETLHVSKNIYQVDPLDLVGRNPVGLLWASPDCKHFSKAKGGRPVKRNIRDLAWTVVLWAKRARPRVIILENVEEFRTWGPLLQDDDGNFRPDPERMGQTFDEWVRQLKRLGYKVEWRELRACDYGTPTIRKRLFVIARRDGKRIVWPDPTHGKPDDPDVIAGCKLLWRTAAEIIDWSLPCPSIFDTSEEIMAKYGIRAKRPLADKTLSRIARGVVRWVMEAKKPFLVVCNHGGDGFRGQGLDAPMQTITAARDAVGLVSPTLIQTGQGERPGQLPRVPGLDKPIGTQVAAGCRHAVVAAFLAQHNNDSRRIGGVNPGRSASEPLATLTAAGAQQQVVAASLIRQFGNSVGSGVCEPVGTITAGGAGKTGIVAASMINLRGSNQSGSAADEPVRTVTASGQHHGVIAAFLNTYYGTSEAHALDMPMGTDTTRDRRSLVTVEIDGTTYAIVDIGMRMLTPRERFRAQGFPDDYEIEIGIGSDGEPVPLTQAQQGACCGNSVCPDLAAALVSANVPELAEEIREAAE